MPIVPDDPNMAQAWISGTPPDQTIDFYIPRGNQGVVGPRGLIGPSLAVGSISVTSDPTATLITPTDSNEPQVWIRKTLDELDFEFYIPANKTEMNNLAIAMAIAL